MQDMKNKTFLINQNIMEEKKIVFFSTEFVDYKEKLFYGAEKVDNFEIVHYDLFVDQMILKFIDDCIKSRDEKLNIFLNFIQEKWPKEPQGYEKEFFNKVKKNKTSWDDNYKIKRIKQMQEKPDFEVLKSWINDWDLGPELLKKFIDPEKQSRALPVKLKDQDVFAIYYLTGAEQEKCNRNNESSWIKALVNFVKNYTGGDYDNTRLYIVLHDKDLSGYSGEDAYVCNEVESQNLSGGEKNCTIVFFAHTTNGFVNILNSHAGERNICSEVEEAIEYYRYIETNKKESYDWLIRLASDELQLDYLALNDELNKRNEVLNNNLQSWIK